MSLSSGVTHSHDDGGSKHRRNIGQYLLDCTVQRSGQQPSSNFLIRLVSLLRGGIVQGSPSTATITDLLYFFHLSSSQF
jgi:hypothetical protein